MEINRGRIWDLGRAGPVGRFRVQKEDSLSFVPTLIIVGITKEFSARTRVSCPLHPRNINAIELGMYLKVVEALTYLVITQPDGTLFFLIFTYL